MKVSKEHNKFLCPSCCLNKMDHLNEVVEILVEPTVFAPTLDQTRKKLKFIIPKEKDY